MSKVGLRVSAPNAFMLVRTSVNSPTNICAGTLRSWLTRRYAGKQLVAGCSTPHLQNLAAARRIAKHALEAMTLASSTVGDLLPVGRDHVLPVEPRDIHTQVEQTMAWKFKPLMWRIMTKKMSVIIPSGVVKSIAGLFSS